MEMNKYMLLLLAAVVIAAFSQILLKKSARRVYPNVLREYLNPWVISGYALMVASTVATVLAYRGVEFKNGPVVESLGFVLVMALSRAFFGEKLTGRKLIGNALILLGVLIFYL